MKRILIVDDNPQNLYMLEILLKSKGYEIAKAPNGQVALDIAATQPPDLIISDILMPTMDGFSLCRKWKTTPEFQKIPFIFYTATYTDDKDITFALSLGADRFLVKPLEPEELLTAITDVFKKLENQGTSVLTTDEKPAGEYFKTYSETLVRKLEEKMLQLERANKQLAALYQASCELTTVKSSDEMIRRVLNTIVETAGYQQANYFAFDQTTQMLSLAASAGFSTETETTYKDQLVFKLGEEKGLVGLVADTGKLLNIGDVKADNRWVLMDATINSALFIPVTFESTLLGVAGLFSREKNAFNEHDEQDISALSNSLAIAIENKRNQEQVQKHFNRLEALHRIDLAINGNMDLREILNIVLSCVFDQMSVDAAGIVLFNRFSLGYEYACGNGFLMRPVDTRDLHQRYILAEKVILERRMVHFESVNSKDIPEGYRSLWDKEGFQEYWGVPLSSRNEVKGALEVFKRSRFIPKAEWLAYLDTLAGQIAIAIDSFEMVEGLKKSNIDLRIAYDATIEGWSRALDLRDNETEDHTLRVVDTTLELAAAMGIKNDDLIHIKRGALLHDIGKMAIPDEILRKPGPLTEEEWVVMRKHPQFAYELLSPIGYLHRALDIPSCHHEKWDGTGYPRGLKGEQIPLAARMFAIVDVWDALRSDRPYRKAWPDDRVIQYIQEQSGHHFDPEVVQVFLSVVQKMKI
ncbi:MAG: response regulator [Leptolinea sp.]|jgi:putative nucleotidyltransferase with HDIG domain|nr:response regulator [Leptolinea sp.]